MMKEGIIVYLNISEANLKFSLHKTDMIVGAPAVQKPVVTYLCYMKLEILEHCMWYRFWLAGNIIGNSNKINNL